MTKTIDNGDNVIDSRDVIARIEELERDRERLVEAVDECRECVRAAEEDPDAVAETPESDPAALKEKLAEAEGELADWDDSDEADELKALRGLADGGESAASDWRHGETLIREDYFEEYCRDLVADLGDLPKDLPGYIENNIDWSGVADDLRHDYTAVDFDGVTYYVR